MTTPVPADPSLDAPSLVGTGIQSLVNESRRLGISWQLTMATVTNADALQVVCDGDTESITVVSMIGAIETGMRVYIIQVPPSGNYIAGTATVYDPIAGSGYGNTAGLVATSTVNAEVAVPTISWNVQPSATFYPGRLYRLDITVGLFTTTAANTMTVIRVRQGAATVLGTALGIWFCDVNPTAINANTATHFSIIKNTTSRIVNTPLSLTNQRSIGGTATQIFFGTEIPCIITITDIGSAATYPTLNAVARSVT